MPHSSNVKTEMLLEPFLENLLIYTENLSFFYLICALVSFLAVWYTWNIEPTTHTIETKEELTEESNSSEHFFTEDSDESIDNSFNSTLDRKVLMKSIESCLSNDDRAKENEIERKQLMDILEIMKNDEKFSSITMEELQEQLKLYRE